jgi:hypothetical protein
MNRQHRRQHEQRGDIQSVPASSIVSPLDMSLDACHFCAITRMQDNYMETGHPFHHRTGDGKTVVATDPTLELYIDRMNFEGAGAYDQFLEQTMKARGTDWLRAVPSVATRKNFYGHDPYEAYYKARNRR